MAAPVGETFSQFFSDEWGRFWQGVDRLDPAAQAAAKVDRARRNPESPGQARVTLPGWSDVIHTGPRTPVSPQEAAAHRAAVRAGRPSPLAPAQVAELDRRRAVADRIANSAQPEYAQAFGQMMTALDNIQDFITTVAALGRLMAWPALRALARYAPTVAAKAGARLIPGLGWIILAGDLINLLAWLGQLATIGYGALCFGPTRGAAAGVAQAAMRGVGGLRPCGMKGAVAGLGELNPFSREARARRAALAGRALPTIGNIIEVAQTTDQLFGTGISFGSVVGAMMEGAYGAELAARGEDVGVFAPAGALETAAVAAGLGALNYKSKALGAAAAVSAAAAYFNRTSTGSMRERHAAAQVMAGAPMVAGTQDVFSEREHVEQLVAYLGAWDIVRRDLELFPWPPVMEQLLTQPMSPPLSYDPATWEVVGQRPNFAESLGRWPLPGNPHELRGADLVEQFQPRVVAGLRDFLEPRRHDVVGMFYGAMVNELAFSQIAWLHGGTDALRVRWTPEWAWLCSLAESNRVVSVADPESAIWDFYQDGVARLRDDDRRQLAPDELDQMALARGLRLIHVEQAFVREGEEEGPDFLSPHPAD